MIGKYMYFIWSDFVMVPSDLHCINGMYFCTLNNIQIYMHDKIL